MKKFGYGAFCAAIAIVGSSGCVIDDFAEDPAQFANGCSRSETTLSTTPLVNITSGGFLCEKVLSGDLVEFKLEMGAGNDVSSCKLRGGTSTGDEATPVEGNPIETDPNDVAKQLSVTDPYSLFLQEKGVVPFYCDGRPEVAGAIFVE